MPISFFWAKCNQNRSNQIGFLTVRNKVRISQCNLPGRPYQSRPRSSSPCKWRSTPPTELGLGRHRLGYEHRRGKQRQLHREHYYGDHCNSLEHRNHKWMDRSRRMNQAHYRHGRKLECDYPMMAEMEL